VVTRVRVALRATAHRFAAGHRVRLSVASAMWPVVWPSPYPAEYAQHLGGTAVTRLVLPTLPLDRPTTPVPAFRTSPAGQREIGSYRGQPPPREIVQARLDAPT